MNQELKEAKKNLTKSILEYVGIEHGRAIEHIINDFFKKNFLELSAKHTISEHVLFMAKMDEVREHVERRCFFDLSEALRESGLYTYNSMKENYNEVVNYDIVVFGKKK